MKKSVDEKVDENVIRWVDHVKRMENDRILKRVYVGEWVGFREGMLEEKGFRCQASKENGPG